MTTIDQPPAAVLQMPFRFTRLDIPELVLVEPPRFDDERGFLLEAFKRSEFRSHGIADDFVQANLSRSAAKVVRGLHYQVEPAAQGKLVSIVRGAVLDVAVDIRVGSPSYGRHLARELTDENRDMLWIPPGFAHGVCTLAEPTDILYLLTAEYDPDCERGIHFLDPELGIEWPYPPSELQASPRDSRLPRFEKRRDFTYAPTDVGR